MRPNRNRLALLCGVANCRISGIGTLPHVDDQVRRLGDLLEHGLHEDFRYSLVQIIPADEATADGLRARLRQIAKMTMLDEVFVYLSGHGMVRDGAANFVLTGGDKRLDEILHLLTEIPAPVTVAVLDFCHAGALAEDMRHIVSADLPPSRNLGIFAATPGDALTDASGPFTDQLTRALQHAADAEGNVSWGRIITEVQEALRRNPYGVPIHRMDRLAVHVVNRVSLQPESTPSDALLLEEYLAAVVRDCEHVEPIGHNTADAGIPLERVYLSLRAEAHLRGLEVDRRALEREIEEIRRDLETVDDRALRERQQEILEELVGKVEAGLRDHAEEVSLHELVRRHRQLVILGEPGAGKTTAMRYLTLRFAQSIRANVSRFLHPDWWKEDSLWIDPELGGMRVPILLRISSYAEAWGARQQSILEYLPAHLATLMPSAHQATNVSRLLLRLLEQGRAIVFFDGLDEMVHSGHRVQIKNQIAVFAGAYIDKGLNKVPASSTPSSEGSAHDQREVPVRSSETLGELTSPRLRRFGSQFVARDTSMFDCFGNHFVVTSRIAGYSISRLEPFRTFVISRMGRMAMLEFLRSWVRVRAPRLDEASIEEKAYEILSSIEQVEGVERLAENPLLLRLIVLVCQDSGEIPRRRYQLYQKAAEKLVIERNRERGMLPDELDLTDGQIIGMLGPIAMWLHQKHASGMASRDEIIRLVAEWLASTQNVTSVEAERRAKVLLEWFRTSTGIIVERTAGFFGFLHRTFAEFFTARELVRDGASLEEKLDERLHLSLWREPLLLAIGAVDRQTADRVIQVVLGRGSAFEEILHRDLLFAADCICERMRIDAVLVADVVARLLALWTDRHGKGRYRSLRLRLSRALLRLYGSHGRLAIDNWLVRVFGARDLNAVLAACELVTELGVQAPAVRDAFDRCPVPIPEAAYPGPSQFANVSAFDEIPELDAGSELTLDEVLPEFLRLRQLDGGLVTDALFIRRGYRPAFDDASAGDASMRVRKRPELVSLVLRAATRVRRTASSMSPQLLRDAMVDVAFESVLLGRYDGEMAARLCRMMVPAHVLADRFRSELVCDDSQRRARATNALARKTDLNWLVPSMETELCAMLDRDFAEAHAAFSLLVPHIMSAKVLHWALSILRRPDHTHREDVIQALARCQVELNAALLAQMESTLDEPFVAGEVIGLLLQCQELGVEATAALLRWLGSPSSTVRATAAVVLGGGCAPANVIRLVRQALSLPRFPSTAGNAYADDDVECRDDQASISDDSGLARLEVALTTGASDAVVRAELLLAVSSMPERVRREARSTNCLIGRWIGQRIADANLDAPPQTLARLLDSAEAGERLLGGLILLRNGLAPYLAQPLAEASGLAEERIARRAAWHLHGDIAMHVETDGHDEVLLPMVRLIHERRSVRDGELTGVVCCGVKFNDDGMVRTWLAQVGQADHPDREVAEWALAHVGYASTVVQATLAEALNSPDASIELKRAAVSALQAVADHRPSRNSPDCAETTLALIDLLQHSDKTLRHLASAALQESTTRDFADKAEALLVAAERVTDPESQVKCLSALGCQLRAAKVDRLRRVGEILEPAVVGDGVTLVLSVCSKPAMTAEAMGVQLSALPPDAVIDKELFDAALEQVSQFWQDHRWQEEVGREAQVLASARAMTSHSNPSVARAAAAAVAQVYDIGDDGIAQVCDMLGRHDVALRALVDILGYRNELLTHGTLESSVGSPAERVAVWVKERPDSQRLIALLIDELIRFGAYFAGDRSQGRDVDFLDSWTHVHALEAVIAHLGELLAPSDLIGSRTSEEVISAYLQLVGAGSERVVGLALRSLGNLQRFTEEMVRPIMECADRRFAAYVECRAAVPKFRRFGAGSVDKLLEAVSDERSSRAHWATLLTGELAASRPEDLGVALRRRMADALAIQLGHARANRPVYEFNWRGRVEENIRLSDVIYNALSQTVGVGSLRPEP